MPSSSSRSSSCSSSRSISSNSSSSSRSSSTTSSSRSARNLRHDKEVFLDALSRNSDNRAPILPGSASGRRSLYHIQHSILEAEDEDLSYYGQHDDILPPTSLTHNAPARHSPDRRSKALLVAHPTTDDDPPSLSQLYDTSLVAGLDDGYSVGTTHRDYFKQRRGVNRLSIDAALQRDSWSATPRYRTELHTPPDSWRSTRCKGCDGKKCKQGRVSRLFKSRDTCACSHSGRLNPLDDPHYFSR